MDRRLWKPHRQIETSYAKEMLDMIYGEVLPAFLKRLPGSFGPLPEVDLDAFAERIARRMIQSVSLANAGTWKAAAQRGSDGRRIYQALRTELQGPVGVRARELVRENAQLIRSLPNDLARSASRFIAAQQRKGLRAETIAAALRARLPEVAESRIRLIARTETAKAETAFTQARSETLSIRWYEWQTSEDQRVRKSHRNMNEVLVAWSDPPSPEALAGERSTLGRYAPGGAPNCRCVALPLVRLDEVTWPHRVFLGDRIRWMTRAEFARIAGLPEVTRRAA